MLPLCVLIFLEALPYVERSWAIREVSRDSGGLRWPAVPLLKSILLLMPVAVLLQGISLLLRSLAELTRS